MSRQIQIRRGTTTEHESFTGAVGEVTMDTDKTTLIIHDGTTTGGIELARADTASTLPEDMDYVIETQIPTSSNNYQWYRKYNSGWIEQGGINSVTGAGATSIITLPVTMVDANYFCSTSTNGQTSSGSQNIGSIITTTTTTIKLANQTWGGNYTSLTHRWEVKGFMAT